MPKKPILSCDELYTILKGWNFLQDTGQYLSYSHDIWQSAATATGNLLHKDYIYQYIKQNRGAIDRNPEAGLSHHIHGNSIPVYKQKIKKRSANDMNWSMKVPKSNEKLNEIQDHIRISLKEWDKLGLQLKKYKGRIYEVLEPGLCDKIYYTIFENLKLPCPFSFKNAKIDRNPGGTFLTIKGACAECKTEIHLYSSTEPTQDGMDFHVSTLDTRGVMHRKNRQLRGGTRQKVGDELRDKTAYLWRRLEAHERMEFGEAEPADLYSSDVLRKLKQETLEKELGLQSGDNPLISMYKVVHSPEWSASIREVALHKPYVMYWLPEQLSMYMIFLRNDRIGSISIDATGTITQTLPSCDGSKSPIFMYQAVTGYKDEILPLFQMASAKHDANTLGYWIREWVRSGARAPVEIVKDYSLALLNGVSMAFNECCLEKYVDKCFSQASKSSVNMEQSTVLRLDIAHLIKFVSNWSCFTKNQHHVKDFFVRCVALLVLQTDIKEFRNLLFAVLTVAFSPKITEGDDNDQCYTSRNNLLTMMKTGLKNWNPKYPDPKNDPFTNLSAMNAAEDDNDDGDENSKERPIISFIKRIENECKKNLTLTGINNKYMCESFGNKLSKLSRQFVLWTHIMPNLHRREFNYGISEVERASSARSEAYFKDLKKFILQGEKTLRLDKVIVQHFRALSGTVNLLGPNKHANGPHRSPASPENENIGMGATDSSQETSGEFYSQCRNTSLLETHESSRNDSSNSSCAFSPQPSSTYSSRCQSPQENSKKDQEESAECRSSENANCTLNSPVDLSVSTSFASHKPAVNSLILSLHSNTSN